MEPESITLTPLLSGSALVRCLRDRYPGRSGRIPLTSWQPFILIFCARIRSTDHAREPGRVRLVRRVILERHACHQRGERAGSVFGGEAFVFIIEEDTACDCGDYNYYKA